MIFRKFSATPPLVGYSPFPNNPRGVLLAVVSDWNKGSLFLAEPKRSPMPSLAKETKLFSMNKRQKMYSQLSKRFPSYFFDISKALSMAEAFRIIGTTCHFLLQYKSHLFFQWAFILQQSFLHLLFHSLTRFHQRLHSGFLKSPDFPI